MTIRSPLHQLTAGPIFVVGAARSGTTWVYDILCAHPLVGGVYESWLFTPQAGLGGLFSRASWSPRPSGLGRLLERRQLIEEVRELSDRILARGIEADHRYLVEKSPSHLYQMDLIHEIYPEARFVHVVRDGRDVCVSVRAAAQTWIPKWANSFGKSLFTSARAWKHALRTASSLAAGLGDRYFEISFEAIKRDPFQAYRELFDYCQIPYDERILEGVFERTDFDRNYSPTETGFRRGGRVGDWKSRFNLLDSLLFNLAAGDALVEAGYEKNRRWLGSLIRRRLPRSGQKFHDD